MDMKLNIAIIGAGPAGITAAYKLQLKGFTVVVYEASNSVGGMAKSFSLWGQIVDLGPHRFFSNDARVNQLWLEVIGRDYSMVSRLTRIYYKKTFFDYPLKALNALFGLGIFQSALCVASYINAKIFPIKPENTFNAWVTNRFGARLFKIFFKSYSEKLWGISCDELDADFAAQRIKKLSLFEAIKAAIFKSKGNKHKTLVDEFAYPHEGAGAVYKLMAEKFIEAGGVLQLNTPVHSIQPKHANGSRPKIILEGGESLEFHHVISTMPITQLIQRMDDVPVEVKECSKKLRFRNTILVYLKISAKSPFPDQWIYVHSSELLTGRITNFSNWVPSITKGQSETILCLEYWCYDDDEVWTRGDADLVDLATREIYQTTLVPEGSVTQGYVARVPKCYPVYATGYRKNLEPVEKFLSSINGVTAIGRYGSFKYNNQDHSILMGLLVAENISESAQHNLWAINTDYEYQESSRITATGLSAN